MSRPDNGLERRYIDAMRSIRAQRFKATVPVVVFLCAFLVLRIAFDYLGATFAPMLALAGAGVVLVIWHWSKSRNTRAKAREAVALRKELSALERQETKLRVQEAREAGKFDKWETRP